jgi:hypothetical protein
VDQALEAAVEVLSDPVQRHELMSPEVIKDLISSIPEAARQMPEVKAMLAAAEGDAESPEFRKKVSASLPEAFASIHFTYDC